MTTYPQREMKVSELQVGDVVQAFDYGPWGSAIVKQINDGQITFFRPYGTAVGSAVYSGNCVIATIGVEEFTRPISDSSMIYVWQREEYR